MKFFSLIIFGLLFSSRLIAAVPLPDWCNNPIFFSKTVVFPNFTQDEIEEAEKGRDFLPELNGLLSSKVPAVEDFIHFQKGSALTLACENAEGMAVYMKVLPRFQNEVFYAFNESRTAWHSGLRCDRNGLLAVPPLSGNKICIVIEGKDGQFAEKVEVSRMFKHVSAVPGLDGFGTSAPCHINFNCPEGDDFKPVNRAVVRIFVRLSNGTTWCTGTLMNNTKRDFKPYILTARHCALPGTSPNLTAPEDFEKWVFYFNFESPGCANPSSQGSLASQFVTGSSVIADSDDGAFVDGSDFLLLLANSNIPTDFQPFYAGWDARDAIPGSGVSIHHPDADIKKISTFSQSPLLTQFGSVAYSHFQIQWVATQSGFGVTQGGSSGGALLDSMGRVIGTLSGGEVSCSNTAESDYYGRMFIHWEGNGMEKSKRVSPWLDPIGGAQFMNGEFMPGTGIVKSVLSPQVKHYPNPANSHIWVENAESACLFDMQGKPLICEDSIDNKMVMDINSLSSGIYVLRAFQDNTTSTFKISILK